MLKKLTKPQAADGDLADSAPAARVSKLQDGVEGEIDSTEIVEHPDNPREIDEHAYKKLVASLRRYGMRGRFIVNKRTGFLLRGHQRLRALREIHGDKPFRVKVEWVDWDEQREAGFLVVDNNQAIAGQFALEPLADLIRKSKVDIAKMGFDAMDLEQLFEGSTIDLNGLLAPPEEKKEPDAVKATLDEAEKVNALKRRKKEYKGDANEEDRTDFFLRIPFTSLKLLEACLDAMERPTDVRVVSGEILATYLGVELPEETEDEGDDSDDDLSLVDGDDEAA